MRLVQSDEGGPGHWPRMSTPESLVDNMHSVMDEKVHGMPGPSRSRKGGRDRHGRGQNGAAKPVRGSAPDGAR